jgi:hypothetical protein
MLTPQEATEQRKPAASPLSQASKMALRLYFMVSPDLVSFGHQYLATALAFHYYLQSIRSAMGCGGSGRGLQTALNSDLWLRKA